MMFCMVMILMATDFVHDADYDDLYDVHGDKDISVDDKNDYNCDKMRMA